MDGLSLTSRRECRWNIRVELSRPVFQALHQINTLTHLHIRLQAGPSIYEPPPPLPLYIPPSPTSIVNQVLIPQHWVSHGNFTPPPPSAPFYLHPPTSALPPPPPAAKFTKTKAPKKAAFRNPPTLSGFKNLKTLSVLDVDDLEIVTELKSCIRNSQGTLSKLRLSFSTSLALRARKPPPEIDPDDSDPDDEFQVVPVSAPPQLPSFDDVSGSARAHRAQEERKTQEAVLGRIFDVEPYMVKKATGRTREKEAEAPKQEPAQAPATEFINSLKAVSNKLMQDLNGSDDWTAAQQDILNTIEAAARKYVAEEDTRSQTPKEVETNGESSTNGSGQADVAEGSSVSQEQKAEASLFDSGTVKSKEHEPDSSNPDDIDVEAPVEDSFSEDAIEPPAAEPASSGDVAASPNTKSAANGDNVEATPSKDPNAHEEHTSASAAPNILDPQHENFKVLAEKLEYYEVKAAQLQKEVNSLAEPCAGVDAMKRVNEAERQIQEFSENIQDIRRDMSVVAAEIDDGEKKRTEASSNSGSDALKKSISEYSRSTRGLGLQTLSVYLIPVKASVLSRAVDLRVLKRITLLNVGNQAPIWALLAKENKVEPLPLRKIFTDNVSVVFLNFISQLPELHELYMLERSEKHKPESFAPRSTVTIEQIRRLALKKHIGTLKSLMIKNQQDLTWDIDTKTTALICTRGVRLEELAISMSIREIVSPRCCKANPNV